VFFALIALLALVVAAARGVSLRRLAETRFVDRGWLGLVVALRVLLNPYLMPSVVAAAMTAPLAPGLIQAGGLIYVASFMFALLFLAAKRHQAGFWFILVGLALNLTVVAANGGQMPGDAEQLARAGLLEVATQGNDGRWSPSGVGGPGTPLAFLSDVIYVPQPFRAPTLVSVGDLVISLGVFAFLNQIRIPRHRRLAASN
jgi:hypothetical protein